MNIAQQREIYRLRSILHVISDASYQYNKVNKLLPLDTVDSSGADQAIESYREIIQKVSNAVASYEESK